jgi:acetyl esterase/lipase
MSGEHGRWPSYTERGSGYILDSEMMRWYFEQALPADWSADDPYLFPLAADNLSGLPPTLLLIRLRETNLCPNSRAKQLASIPDADHASVAPVNHARSSGV